MFFPKNIYITCQEHQHKLENMTILQEKITNKVNIRIVQPYLLFYYSSARFSFSQS